MFADTACRVLGVSELGEDEDTSTVINSKIAMALASCPGDETLRITKEPLTGKCYGGTMSKCFLGGSCYYKCEAGFLTILTPVSLEMMCKNFACNKFMYEVVIGSKDIYQIGWSKPDQPWSLGNGVGDYALSYGIDGSRSCLWKNGAQEGCSLCWAGGDVIGCCVDITDSNCVKLNFYKNGMIVNRPEIIGPFSLVRSLVPALTISEHQYAHVNLGSRPFLYPINGYAPVIRGVGDGNILAAKYLAGCIERLSAVMCDSSGDSGAMCDEYIILLCEILSYLAPLLRDYPYLVTDTFVPLLVALCQDGYTQFFGTLFDCLQQEYSDDDFKRIIGSVIGSLALDYVVYPPYTIAKQCLPEDLSVPDHDLVGRTKLALPFEATAYLACLTVVCQHFPLDKFLDARNVDFSLDLLMSIHIPSKTDLLFLYPTAWWRSAKEDYSLNQQAFREANQRYSLMLSIIRNEQTKLCRVFLQQNILIPYLGRLVDRCKDYRKSMLPKGLPDLLSVTNIFFVVLSMFQDHISSSLSCPESIKPQFTQILNDHGFRSQFDRVGGTIGELLKSCDLSSVDTTSPVSDDARIFEYLCYLNDLCVSLLVRFVKHGVKKTSVMITQLSYYEEIIPRISTPAAMARVAESIKTTLKIACRIDASLVLYLTCNKSQEDLGHFLHYLSLWTLHAHESLGPLFGFISEPYLFTLNRTLTLLRSSFLFSRHFLDRCDSDDTIISFVTQSLATLGSSSIVLPHIRENHQNCLLICISDPKMRSVIFKNPFCQRSLIPSIMQLSLTKDKQQVSRLINMLRSIFEGLNLFDTKKSSPEKQIFIDSFKAFIDTSMDVFYEFINNLIDGINGTLTNFNSCLDSVPDTDSNEEEIKRSVVGTCQEAVMNIVMTQTLEFLTGYIPQVYSRDVDSVRISECIVFCLNRLHQSSPESVKLKRVHQILKKFPPSFVKKYGFGRHTLLIPVIGACLNFYNCLGTKALDHLKATSGYSLAMLDTMNEVFTTLESQVGPNPAARSLLDRFIGDARKAGETIETMEVDEDELCPICYLNKIDAQFMPCGHTMCKVCGERSMIDNPCCPFCRSHIDSLVPFDSTQKRPEEPSTDAMNDS